MSYLADITPTLFYGVAWLGVLLTACFVVIGVSALTKPSFWDKLKAHLLSHSMLYIFVLALVAMVDSLWLSIIAQYTPCELCWYQRIFLYPIVFVAGFGYFKKIKVRPIIITLSAIAAVIAGYHYALQRLVFLQSLAPCQANASCSSMYLGYWGWYSIPLMSCTIAVAILILAIFFLPTSTKRKKQAKK